VKFPTIPALETGSPGAARAIDLKCPDVQVWRTPAGEPQAYYQQFGEAHWLHVIGVGVFCVSHDQETVRVWPQSSDLVVQDTYRRYILPFVMQLHGLEVLHASAVRLDEEIVALCGSSESGKSSLAYGLSLRGLQQCADDAVPFLCSGRKVVAMQLPFRARLRQSSAEHFGFADQEMLSPDAAPTAQTLTLTSIFVLHQKPAEDEGVQIDRVFGSEAFMALVAHAYSLDLEGSQKASLARAYLCLVNCARIFRLKYPYGLRNLTTVLDAVQSEIASRGEDCRFE
jgi:hypothetical protein